MLIIRKDKSASFASSFFKIYNITYEKYMKINNKINGEKKIYRKCRLISDTVNYVDGIKNGVCFQYFYNVFVLTGTVCLKVKTP
jgi:hypothetical protein